MLRASSWYIDVEVGIDIEARNFDHHAVPKVNASACICVRLLTRYEHRHMTLYGAPGISWVRRYSVFWSRDILLLAEYFTRCDRNNMIKHSSSTGVINGHDMCWHLRFMNEMHCDFDVSRILFTMKLVSLQLRRVISFMMRRYLRRYWLLLESKLQCSHNSPAMPNRATSHCIRPRRPMKPRTINKYISWHHENYMPILNQALDTSWVINTANVFSYCAFQTLIATSDIRLPRACSS